MNVEELKKHCEKQVERCKMLHDSKHEAEHQIVLDLIKENKKYKEVIDKLKEYLIDTIPDEFEFADYSIKRVKDILKEVE